VYFSPPPCVTALVTTSLTRSLQVANRSAVAPKLSQTLVAQLRAVGTELASRTKLLAAVWPFRCLVVRMAASSTRLWPAAHLVTHRDVNRPVRDEESGAYATACATPGPELPSDVPESRLLALPCP
jgi:hypothetical protein